MEDYQNLGFLKPTNSSTSGNASADRLHQVVVLEC